MLKKSDIGIILKQWDNVPHKHFISVALGIQIPFDNDEISVKAMCNARSDQDRTLYTIYKHFTALKVCHIHNDLVQVRNSPHKVHFSHGILDHLDNGKPRLVREKNAIPLLSKPALVCMCPIYKNTIYAVTTR